MTLKRDNLVFPLKVTKPLGREKFFRLQVGREEKILGTYGINHLISSVEINFLTLNKKSCAQI
jgi:hypothetical protein